MDKKTLLVLSFFIIPGFGFLWTLIDPQFMNIQPINWWDTVTARVILTIFSFVVSGISIGLIIMKKYSTIDSIQDIIDKKEIDKITDFIDIYIKESHISSNKDSINEWVTKKFKK